MAVSSYITMSSAYTQVAIGNDLAIYTSAQL